VNEVPHGRKGIKIQLSKKLAARPNRQKRKKHQQHV